MKLFTPQDAQLSSTRQQAELKMENTKLLEWFHTGLKRYNAIKDNYDPEKVKAQKEFEAFVAALTTKKSVLLQELAQLQDLIKQKHDVIDALMVRQDQLDEREYELARRKLTLDDRERFIKEIETKQSLI